MSPSPPSNTPASDRPSNPGPRTPQDLPPQFSGNHLSANSSDRPASNGIGSNGFSSNGIGSHGDSAPLPRSPKPGLEAYGGASPLGQTGFKTDFKGWNWERWVLITLLLLGGGYGLWQWLGPKPPGAAGGPPGGPPVAMQGPPPRPVVTTLLRAGVAGEQVQLLGQVESGDSTTLRSQAEGVIEQLTVIAGDAVASGDVIATLEDVDQRLALAEAQAGLTEAEAALAQSQSELAEAKSNLAELNQGTRGKVVAQRRAALEAAKAREAAARDNLKRVQELSREGAVADRLLVEAQASINTAVSDRLAAQANLDDAEAGPRSDELEAEQAKVSAQEAAVKAQAAAVQAEEAAVAQALLALQRTRIIATAPGIVNDKLVNVGDYVRSADPVLELIDNSAIDILLELPEARAAQIEPGQPVVLRSRALPGWEARTAIDSLTPIASATSRSRAARIRLTDPPPGLLPGTALVAALEISGSSSGYQVSRDVLTRRDGQWLVYGIQAGGPEQPSLAQEIPVNLVSDNGETVIIDSPELSPNFEIVLKGGDALQDQAPVMVVEGPSAQPRPGTASDGEAQGGEEAQGGGAQDGGAQDGEEAQDGASLLPGLSVALPWSIAAQEA